MKRTICIALSLVLSTSILIADNLGLHTVVIDAGHGGKDPGCVSKDGKTYEKTITLEIAQILGKMISENYPEVKVIQTRNKDLYLSLNERAEIANKADADLFISIHINSTASSSPHGYSVHILGQSSGSNKDYVAYNMDVVKRENSVILLEEDYDTKYQGFDPTDPESFIFLMLMQNSYREQSSRFGEFVIKNLKGSVLGTDRGMWPNGFYVLWKTAMPSALIELGFISNQSDLDILRKKASREDLARCLYKAFSEYKTMYDASIGATVTRSAKPEPSAEPQNPVGKETVSSTKPQKAQPNTRVTEDKPKTAETKSQSEKKTSDSESKAQTVDQNSSKYYAVQIFATSKILSDTDSRLKGYKAKYIKVGNLYKYFIGMSENEEQIREKYQSIKPKFPDSFMVVVDNENISRLK